MLVTDNQLIKKVKRARCSASLEALHLRHGGLVNSMINKYASASSNAQCSGVTGEDFRDDALSIVYQAALKFDENKKSKFSTWLGNSTRFHCLNTIKKQKKYVDGASYLQEYADKASNEAEIESKRMLGEAEYVMNLLNAFHDPRVRRIFKMRYFTNDKKNLSFAEIAKKLNMSTQGIIDIHDETREFIRRKSLAVENMDKI